MARKKKKSDAFKKLAERLSGIKAIDEKLDLGNGLSVDAITAKVNAYNTELEEYNIILKNADAKLNLIEERETSANDLSEKLLLAVAVKYGKDSQEYQMAGGKRKSDIKRNTPRPRKGKKNT
jgi:hypothetical protein